MWYGAYLSYLQWPSTARAPSSVRVVSYPDVLTRTPPPQVFSAMVGYMSGYETNRRCTRRFFRRSVRLRECEVSVPSATLLGKVVCSFGPTESKWTAVPSFRSYDDETRTAASVTDDPRARMAHTTSQYSTFNYQLTRAPARSPRTHVGAYNMRV